MKKTFLLPALCLVLFCCAVAVLAAGSAEDPLISLSHLNGTYRESVDAAVQEKLDAAENTLRGEITGKLDEADFTADRQWAETWTERRLKQSDTLTGPTGFSVLALAGSITVTYDTGAVVDVTAGTVVPSGSVLTANHRYLTAENTSARFTVTSQTAVAEYVGQYTLSLSAATDYNAMAEALRQLHLFRGTYTAYGSGFDLEVAPTRLQALIMFIRVLGEEEAALAYTGLPPFSDISPNTNAARYVGYAYEKGYTNGYKDGTWKPGGRTNINQYTEFLLRALGYSSVDSGISISTAPQRALEAGLMTADDVKTLTAETFLRAHLVYLSFQALSVAEMESGTPLWEVLAGKGVFTAAEYAAIPQINPPAA